jgi:hypothetical protein
MSQEIITGNIVLSKAGNDCLLPGFSRIVTGFANSIVKDGVVDWIRTKDSFHKSFKVYQSVDDDGRSAGQPILSSSTKREKEMQQQIDDLKKQIEKLSAFAEANPSSAAWFKAYDEFGPDR